MGLRVTTALIGAQLHSFWQVESEELFVQCTATYDLSGTLMDSEKSPETVG